MTMTRTKLTATIVVAISSLALTACDRSRPEPEESPTPAASATPEEKVSIFRPDVEVAPVEAPLVPLEATVSFAEGGTELSDAARMELAAVLQSEQMERGEKITLRGHTDSIGNDEGNLRASRQRAEAVRDYLVENGVSEDRIDVIALGEMRPAAPNANLDGTPNEAGRAANRRVDVTIAVPDSPSTAGGNTPDTEPTSTTLVEAIAGDE